MRNTSADYIEKSGRVFEGCRGLDTASKILAGLAGQAAEGGFRNAVGEWFVPVVPWGTQEGGHNVNVIPGGREGGCQELLVVASTGRNQFDTRLREAHDHCSMNCPGITKGVLFVTDYWDNEKFWESRAPTFDALSRKYRLVLAAAIWTGKSFAVEQVLP